MSARSPIRPGRLRRRLTIAFMLVAGLSGAALAAGSYLVARESRLDDSVERALDQSRFNLEFASSVLASPQSRTEAVRQLLDALERRSGFATAVRVEGQDFSSSISIRPALAPPDLVAQVRRGQLTYQRTEFGGVPYLVVGGRVSGAELYFFFSEAQLLDELGQLRTILLVGLALLVLVAGGVGTLVARRTLAPVAEASAAARSLAEGLLATRLPPGRDEFGAWAASFNEMADALEGKIAALSEAQARERRFTSDVAHELRTPVTALVGEASLLSEHLDRMPPEARRPAELVVADIARLRRLVEDLMEISRLDAGQGAVRLEPVDLASLVDATIRARGWIDRVRIQGADAVVESDRRRLEQIVANLVGNALEHGGRDVAVRTGADDAGAFVEVEDEGGGMTPEHLERLFDRFSKADPSRTGAGSGLGLAIALENASLLGGDIEVWSELDRGSRFTLRLPPSVAKPLQSGNGPVAGGAQDEARNRVGG
ncbi:HAMP domain-containing sensor histidine kinase [soil metagenome]